MSDDILTDEFYADDGGEGCGGFIVSGILLFMFALIVVGCFILSLSIQYP